MEDPTYETRHVETPGNKAVGHMISMVCPPGILCLLKHLEKWNNVSGSELEDIYQYKKIYSDVGDAVNIIYKSYNMRPHKWHDCDLIELRRQSLSYIRSI